MSPTAPIAPEEAWSRIAPYARPLPEERVGRRAAIGRVLARPLAATVDQPAVDVSAMDGFAVAGPVEPGERRPVATTLPAGVAPGFVLAPPAVARIMTGAPLPLGADRVVPVERTAPGGSRDEVVFQNGVPAGEHVRRRGEILRAGGPLLAAGTRLGPGTLSLLAGQGIGEVPVHRAPRVAILATGDEVVAPEAAPGPGQLRDSHTDFLLAAGSTLGLAFTPLGIAPDRTDALAPLVERGLGFDVLLLCGGVSMGEHDLAEGVLAALGYRVLIDAVAIQPGKPLVFAVAATPPAGGSALVFGLPGNPASVMVGFWLFVRPLLRRLLGHDDAFWHGAVGTLLSAPVPAPHGRDRFLPAALTVRDGQLHAAPVVAKGSHDIAGYATAGGLVRLPAGSGPLAAGAPCEVLPLPG